MDPAISDLEPKPLWKYFDLLRAIPRCSKHEEKAAEWVVTVARGMGLETRRDEAGNVSVRKPAAPGFEGAPTVVLQGHLDMVCEKNKEVEFDFTKDPIQLTRDGEYLYARGTTLGADNGIGVSAALALMEERFDHGPLEFLFTVDEETGLTGAFKLDPSLITGKILLNLDSEDEGTFTVGCAGGGDTKIILPVGTRPPALGTAVIVRVKGLRGGHSGVEIHEQRGNAIKVLVRALAGCGIGFNLFSLAGGDKHNAIPREAEAGLIVDDPEGLRRALARIEPVLREEVKAVDPDLAIEVEETTAPATSLEDLSQKRLLDLLQTLPHGVLKMSYEIPGLVQTSTNLASVKVDLEKRTATVHMSSRSSLESELEAVRDMLDAHARLVGATTERHDAYPGWQPNMESPLLATCVEVHKELFGKEPAIEAIHAGLETGIIGKRFEGMDMISFGPTVQHPHSPEERVHLPTVERFYRLTKAILARLARA